MYKTFIKRFIDIILSFIGMVILIPFFIIIGAVIYIDDPGPIFFRQQRLGKNKEPFWLYKFRSMKVNTPQIPGYMLDDADSYITRVGKLIRKLSIDELPQIYNIFLGHMSIVGYRPALYENEDELTNERDEFLIHENRPGLTGWAQVNGRDSISISQKVQYDKEYSEILNHGGISAFIMDFKCVVITVLKVLKRSDIVEGTILNYEDEEVLYK